MFAVERNLSQVRFNLGIVLRAVGMSTGLAVWDTRAVGHEGCGTQWLWPSPLPLRWASLWSSTSWEMAGREGVAHETPTYSCFSSSQKSHGKRSLSSDLGLLLSSKREQEDEMTALLLHTFIQDRSLFWCAKGFWHELCFPSGCLNATGSSHFLSWCLIYGASRCRWQTLQCEEGLESGLLIHFISIIMTKVVQVTQAWVRCRHYLQ